MFGRNNEELPRQAGWQCHVRGRLLVNTRVRGYGDAGSRGGAVSCLSGAPASYRLRSLQRVAGFRARIRSTSLRGKE